MASKILTEVAMRQGYDVKMTEIHGMAQRGGSVVTQVRMEKVHSPLIEPVRQTILWPSNNWKACAGALSEQSWHCYRKHAAHKPHDCNHWRCRISERCHDQIKASAPNMVQLDALEIAKQLEIYVVNVVPRNGKTNEHR